MGAASRCFRPASRSASWHLTPGVCLLLSVPRYIVNKSKPLTTKIWQLLFSGCQGIHIFRMHIFSACMYLFLHSHSFPENILYFENQHFFPLISIFCIHWYFFGAISYIFALWRNSFDFSLVFFNFHGVFFAILQRFFPLFKTLWRWIFFLLFVA